uniref:Uncharacterized protein n=1 Tax=viral metagenome TaxID=1070528 RepID=A0A6M3LWD5_9ZZZZ
MNVKTYPEMNIEILNILDRDDPMQAYAAQRIRELEQENAEMLRVIQEVYKKHHMELEDAMGWDELGDLIHDTLSNVMGQGELNDWIEDVE